MSRSKSMERVLQQLSGEAWLTPYEWFERVNVLCKQDRSLSHVTLGEFCECVQTLLAVGFIQRDTRLGDADGKSVVALYRKTKATGQ